MTQIEEVNVDEFKHLVSERALTGETMLLNMGPQHPSTHGVLRLLLELDGETIVNAIPDIGYLHTGIEKNMEAKTYLKAEVMSDRLDYMNNLGNNLVYCMAVEKLVELDVPERARAIRVILTELERINSHLVWVGTFGLDLAAMSMFLYAFREREMILDIKELVSGQRMMTTYFRIRGRRAQLHQVFPQAHRRIRSPADQESALPGPAARHRQTRTGRRPPKWRDGTDAARLGHQLGPAQGTALPGLRPV
jgi:NADH-quinone oxidoreductase subunit D